MTQLFLNAQGLCHEGPSLHGVPRQHGGLVTHGVELLQQLRSFVPDRVIQGQAEV